jgi:uncharacterized membrane protein YbhN (UPF0104 family)
MIGERSRGGLPLPVAIGLAAFCFVAVLGGLSLVAGWRQVADQLHPNLSFWFAFAFAAEIASFAGYTFAYRSVAGVEGGPRLSLSDSVRLVAIGFGAFLAKGGGALDKHALRPSGTEEAEGEVRVLTLDALEHAPLAPSACAASLALLLNGDRTPGLDFTIPWATLVPVGAVLALYGVKHRQHFEGRNGWRGRLGQILYAIELLFRMARDRRKHWSAFAGASVYWAGDVLCLWACLKPFGAAPQFAAVVVAHAAGYVLTRRTLPLAGAGIVELLMPITLTASGAPLPGAILGVLAYRIYNLWLPLIPALVAQRAEPAAQKAT